MWCEKLTAPTLLAGCTPRRRAAVPRFSKNPVYVYILLLLRFLKSLKAEIEPLRRLFGYCKEIFQKFPVSRLRSKGPVVFQNHRTKNTVMWDIHIQWNPAL